jgi:hypothetical protein
VYFSASKHAPLEKHYYVAAFAHLLTPLLLVKLSRYTQRERERERERERRKERKRKRERKKERKKKGEKERKER